MTAELMYARAELVLPHGARRHQQMTCKDIRKAKIIANLSIHVAQTVQKQHFNKIL